MDKFVIALDEHTRKALEEAGYNFVRAIRNREFYVFENKPELKFSDENINILTTNFLTFD